MQDNKQNADVVKGNVNPADNAQAGAANNDANVGAQGEQQVAVITVIDKIVGENPLLKDFLYNGVPCETPEQKLAALRDHYKLSVLRKYGITPRDEQDQPLKNNLIINNTIVRAKLPAILVDENEAATENLKEYYERTRKRAAGAYTTIIKGLERIDFLAEML